jgi:hypothetical protein
MRGSFRQGALLRGDSRAPVFVVIIIDLVVVKNLLRLVTGLGIWRGYLL